MNDPNDVVALRTLLSIPIAVPEDQLGSAFDGAARRVRTRVRRRAVGAMLVAVAATGGTIAAVHATTANPVRVVATDRPERGGAAVLETPQTPDDLLLFRVPPRLYVGAVRSTVRLLAANGDGRVYGYRDVPGNYGIGLVLGQNPEDSFASGGSTPASRFATNGVFLGTGTQTRGALGLFVPDAALRATVDGKPVAITRNGLLVQYAPAAAPHRIVLVGRRGSVVITAQVTSDGSPEFSESGSLQ